MLARAWRIGDDEGCGPGDSAANARAASPGAGSLGRAPRGRRRGKKARWGRLWSLLRASAGIERWAGDGDGAGVGRRTAGVGEGGKGAFEGRGWYPGNPIRNPVAVRVLSYLSHLPLAPPPHAHAYQTHLTPVGCVSAICTKSHFASLQPSRSDSFSHYLSLCISFFLYVCIY